MRVLFPAPVTPITAMMVSVSLESKLISSYARRQSVLRALEAYFSCGAAGVSEAAMFPKDTVLTTIRKRGRGL